jgi:SAM-dependent methyltransferase
MSDAAGPSPISRRSQGFEQAYQGHPPWDIGRPQPEVERLVENGELVGRVLDVGCGTGENALELARRGLDVLGVDAAPTAIRLAREKATARRSRARFEIADALELGSLGLRFDSVLDCGLFHVFDEGDRRQYVASLGRAVRDGGRYFVLAFSDAEPPDWGGPRRISEAELREAFRGGWTVELLRAARFATMDPAISGHAWSARIRRDGA